MPRDTLYSQASFLVLFLGNKHGRDSVVNNIAMVAESDVYVFMINYYLSPAT